MRLLLVIFATIHIALADCESMRDDDARAFFYFGSGDSQAEGSTALLLCKHVPVDKQQDKFMTCNNGEWTPAPETFGECPMPADCDVAELQQSRKLSRYVIPYGTDKVSHGQYTYGYCGIGEEEDRITYYCDNGKWTAKDTCASDV